MGRRVGSRGIAFLGVLFRFVAGKGDGNLLWAISDTIYRSFFVWMLKWDFCVWKTM